MPLLLPIKTDILSLRYSASFESEDLPKRISLWKKSEMRLAISLLVVFAACAATAQQAEDNYYAPHYGPNVVAPRFLVTTTTTTTTVSTSTSVVPCTSGAFGGLIDGPALAALPLCSGRRRRGILEVSEEADNEQFSILPSAVQGVEATPVPNREARNADPQYLMMSPFGYSFYPQEIQPGFYGGPYGPFFLPFPGSNAQPVAGNRIFFNPILNAVLPPFLKQTSTSTVTLTAFAISTSTSVAACRPPPAVARCAGT
ncbi:Uncharacterized protein APZ42_030557 [Daphnia magna]|uniref:Uncharacterized protein n=1 Tax=Daphnia magna TaxID=35525 RepID=A0A162D2U8_9CRUS|nr:Uncharacterized protein APZ42_030557 [Daphnia magna]